MSFLFSAVFPVSQIVPDKYLLNDCLNDCPSLGLNGRGLDLQTGVQKITLAIY